MVIQPEKIVQNAWITLVGRFAMIVCAGLFPILVPAAITALWGIESTQVDTTRKLEVWQAKTDAKIEGLTTSITGLATGRYTEIDARRDFQLRDLKIDTLSMRLADLESQIRAMERSFPNARQR